MVVAATVVVTMAIQPFLYVQMVELLMELVYKECVQVDIHVPIIMFAALVIVAIQLTRSAHPVPLVAAPAIIINAAAVALVIHNQILVAVNKAYSARTEPKQPALA